MNNRKLLNQIYRKVDSEMTDEKLLTGKAYEKYASSVVSGVSEQYGAQVHVTIACDKSKGARVAFTNGRAVWANAWSDAFGVIENVTTRHWIVLGLLLHECGHILWTNFELAETQHNRLMNDHKLYPAPNGSQTELIQFLDEHPEAAGSVASLLHTICNCVEDGFIEKRLLKEFPGYGNYLAYARSRNEKDMPGITEQRDKEGLDVLSRLINLILWQAKYGHICKLDPSEYEDEAVVSFYRIRELIDAASDEMSSYFRGQKINELFLEVFRIFKEQNDKKQQDPQNGTSTNRQGGGQGGSNQPQNSDSQQDGKGQSQQKGENQQNNGGQKDGNDQSSSGSNNGQNGSQDNSEAVKKLLQSLSDAASQAEKVANDGTSHQNTGKPANDPAESQSMSLGSGSGSGKEQPQGGGKMEKAPQSSSTLESIRKEEVEGQVGEEINKRLTNQITVDVKDISHDAGIHKGVASQVHRAAPESGEARYESQHVYLDALARRMMKNLQKEIKDRQLGDALDGNYFGNRLDTNNLYRRDKKLYIRDILPEDIPDMEISILIDCSGSMSGEKIEVARKTAYTVWKFCQMLKIPVTVMGHNTRGSGVSLYSVADGDSIDGNDGRRIFSLSAGGCNRDGFALRAALKKLYRSQAADRIMFVISDGLPNDGSYGLEEGRADIRDAVAKAKKEGINVITAGIGESAKMIKNIWIEGVSVKRAATFLELEKNLERLPKSFVKIIKAQLAA